MARNWTLSGKIRQQFHTFKKFIKINCKKASFLAPALTLMNFRRSKNDPKVAVFLA